VLHFSAKFWHCLWKFATCPAEMSGLWIFLVRVQSWSDEIESDPVLIHKVFENHRSDPALIRQLPSLHCTVIVFALDWESHKSLKHDHECLTELLERACFQPQTIQRIQLAEVSWESDNKRFERKRCWVVRI